jgi:hypothetical protein
MKIKTLYSKKRSYIKNVSQYNSKYSGTFVKTADDLWTVSCDEKLRANAVEITNITAEESIYDISRT